MDAIGRGEAGCRNLLRGVFVMLVLASVAPVEDALALQGAPHGDAVGPYGHFIGEQPSARTQ
jgi:hypothetical protein